MSFLSNHSRWKMEMSWTSTCTLSTSLWRKKRRSVKPSRLGLEPLSLLLVLPFPTPPPPPPPLLQSLSHFFYGEMGIEQELSRKLYRRCLDTLVSGVTAGMKRVDQERLLYVRVSNSSGRLTFALISLCMCMSVYGSRVVVQQEMQGMVAHFWKK